MNLVLPIWKSPARSLVTLFAASMLAILHQYLFFGHIPGISVPIFVMFFYGFMLMFAGDRLASYTKFNGLLSLVIVMLSFTYVLFDNIFFHLLNFIILPILIAVHLTVWMGHHTRGWFQTGIIGDTLLHLIPRTFRHFPTAFASATSSVSEKMNEGTRKTVRKVFIGIAIAAPLLVFVITLLSSADGMFESFLNAIPNWLDQITYSEGFFRLTWIFIFTLLFFGYVSGFVHPVAEKKEDESKLPMIGASEQPNEKKSEDDNFGVLSLKLDPVIAATVLILINIVYVIFVVLQFSYLFGAWEGALPEGMTYADYARKGFAELMIVALLNFTILMTVLLHTGDSSRLLRRINHLMLYILVLCSLIILYSAYSRLNLYEEAYGFTYIRFLVHAFMIFLGVLMVIAGIWIQVKRIPLAKCYIILGLVAYVMVNYAGMDSYIAEKNMERYHLTGELDENFITSLSVDAIPVLIEFSEEYPRMNHHLKDRYLELTQQERAWPSFNYSEYKAEKALSHHISGISAAQ
ncbi:DUF4173 domain-containing protein [Paenibacillus sp. Marseille-Q4541]|uniref:DUF4153 domain-containing protein n=1 Tax=Paenibacillus sp. Marseille-Q4541 TaxID=2831522 RepID=UPI001BAE2FE3|nr:DUF4173 domain-containing protein [Paenibacillus sp. Marseille-Q4541]